MNFGRRQACPFSTKQIFRLLTTTLVLGPLNAFAAQSQSNALIDLSLEELANIEITSVSKRPERALDAPASIFVITNDDIRRSGARSLPEALRLAPNLDVSRVNASGYAISARGFNNSIGNKLLVLIDGRTVYTPLFSGVNWDMQNVMLEDVERIEVISGPGATLWGANAVNGVINVITRRAEDTQGNLLSATAGNQGEQGAARHGGKLGEDGYFRLYATGFNQDNTTLNDNDVMDAWHMRQAGFRADWGTASNGFTVQGDVYDNKMQDFGLGNPTRSGANLLARWEKQLNNGSQLHVQGYFDQTEHYDPAAYRDREDTFDLEIQHSFQAGKRQRILWGGGTRHTRSKTETDIDHAPIFPLELAPGVFVPAQILSGYNPATRNLHWNNLFVQDEISLNNDVTLTLGIKAEDNSYTGVEWLPSARLAWRPDNNSVLWTALSKAVRAPSRIDRDLNLYIHLPTLPPPGNDIYVIQGGPDFRAETAKVLELGYRAQPTQRLSYSVTAFYSDYDHLRSGQPFPPAAHVQNMMEGHTYGIETWGSYQATPVWRLSAGLHTLRENFRLKPGSTDPDGFRDAGNDADLTWMLRSSYNVSSTQEFDVMVRHTGALPDPALPAYTAVDLRYGWRFNRELELALIVTDLLDDSHPEFIDDDEASYEIGRSVGLKATWTF